MSFAVIHAAYDRTCVTCAQPREGLDKSPIRPDIGQPSSLMHVLGDHGGAVEARRICISVLPGVVWTLAAEIYFRADVRALTRFTSCPR